MLFAPTLLLAGSPAAATITCNYVAATQYATNTTSPSTSVNIGTGATGRFVIIAVSYYSLSSGSLSSPTIDGVAATIIAQSMAASGQAGIALIGRQMDAGGSVTVAATMSTTSQVYQFDVYEAFNLSSITPSFTASDNVVSSSVLSTTIDIPTGGLLIAALSGIDGTATAWTGPTEGHDTTYNSQQRSGAKDVYVASQSGYTVEATVTSMGARGALVAASWSP